MWSEGLRSLTGVLVLLGFILVACDNPQPRQEKRLPMPKGESTLDELIKKSQAKPVSPSTPADLAFDMDAVSFENISVGETSSRRVVLKNAGDLPATLTRLHVAGQSAFFTLSGQCVAGLAIAGHAGCALDVTYRPMAEGRVDGEVSVSHSTGTLFLSLSGQARPRPIAKSDGVPEAMSANMVATLEFARQRQDSGLVVEIAMEQGDQPRNPLDADYTEAGLGGIVSSFPVDRTRVITADRYIPAVLENTINSQLPGRAIAVVERNVYGAAGRSVLIPAGARVIGRYRSLGRYGEARIDVSWSRIILPNGANINIDDQAADVMGRTGLPGDLDSRFFEKYGSSLLTSAIAAAGDLLLDGTSTTVTSQFGGTTQAQSGKARAATRLGNDIDSLGQRMVQENIDIRPVLTVPQGTRLDIIPTEDIWLRDPDRLQAVTPPKGGGGKAVAMTQAQSMAQMIPGLVDLLAQNPNLQRLAPQTSQQIQQANILQQLRDYGGTSAPSAATPSSTTPSTATSTTGGTRP